MKSGLYESQAGIKIAGRNINNLRYADDSTRMAESEEKLKESLDKGERRDWKSLKLNIQETKIMASSPTTSWQIGKMWEQCQISFSWAPKSMQTVTAATKLKDACSLEK